MILVVPRHPSSLGLLLRGNSGGASKNGASSGTSSKDFRGQTGVLLLFLRSFSAPGNRDFLLLSLGLNRCRSLIVRSNRFLGISGFINGLFSLRSFLSGLFNSLDLNFSGNFNSVFRNSLLGRRLNRSLIDGNRLLNFFNSNIVGLDLFACCFFSLNSLKNRGILLSGRLSSIISLNRICQCNRLLHRFLGGRLGDISGRLNNRLSNSGRCLSNSPNRLFGGDSLS